MSRYYKKNSLILGGDKAAGTKNLTGAYYFVWLG